MRRGGFKPADPRTERARLTFWKALSLFYQKFASRNTLTENGEEVKLESAEVEVTGKPDSGVIPARSSSSRDYRMTFIPVQLNGDSLNLHFVRYSLRCARSLVHARTRDH
jgi:hypothetical protein